VVAATLAPLHAKFLYDVQIKIFEKYAALFNAIFSFHTKQQYCGYMKYVFNFGLVAMINESLELGIREVGMAPVRKPSAYSGDIYKSIITNVVMVRNFEVISEKFKVDQKPVLWW
jgi:hypothetical protein